MTTPVVVAVVVLAVCGTLVACSGMWLAWRLEGAAPTEYEKLARQLEAKAQKERLAGFPATARQMQSQAEELRDRAREQREQEEEDAQDS